MREYLSSASYPIWYRVANVFLLAVSVLGSFGTFLGTTQIGTAHIFFLLVLIGLYAWINFGKVNERIISLGLIAMLLLVVVPLWIAGDLREFYQNYVMWLGGVSSYENAWVLGYEWMQIAWISLLCYIAQFLMAKSLIAKGMACALLLAGLGVEMAFQIPAQAIGVAFSFGYVLTLVIETLQKYWEKHKTGDSREYVLYLMPFVVLYMMLVMLMPSSKDPYDWKFFVEAYSNIREKVIAWVEDIGRNGREDFGQALAGFSEDGGLNWGIATTAKEYMEVSGTRNQYTNVYLTGKIYDSFDGMNWESKHSYKTDPAMDTLELMYAVYNRDPDYISNYYVGSKLRVQYKYFNTEYAFAPGKWTLLSGEDISLKGSELHFKKKVGYGTTYDTTYYQLNLNATCFQDMLKSERKDSEINWEYIVSNRRERGWKKYSYKDLLGYREQMEKDFGKDVAISQEVSKYVASITEGCKTDYEKLRAIEKHLSYFTYNSNPGKMPESVNSEKAFLDYFLLESKQGYCSYFATAFVLLARAEGLPARYVEGFCVPVNKDKFMVVKSDMSHAWPEVYFEGVGWIPFEPTPGYDEIRYSGWKTKDPTQEPDRTEVSQLPYDPNEQEEEVTEVEPVVKETKARKIWPWVAALVALIFVCVLALFIERSIQRRRYYRMDTEQKYVNRVNRLLWIYERMGFRRSDFETLDEFKGRLAAGIEDALEGDRRSEFLISYQEYLYGTAKITEDRLLWMKQEEDSLTQYLKTKKKWLYLLVWLRMWM